MLLFRLKSLHRIHVNSSIEFTVLPVIILLMVIFHTRVLLLCLTNDKIFFLRKLGEFENANWNR